MNIRIWVISILLFFLLPWGVLAQTPTGPISDIDNQINQLQSKITELKGQEDSLSRQIVLIDSEISLTRLQIEQTKVKINELSAEINQLIGEIGRLEDELTKRTIIVLRRIPASYKRQATPQFAMLFLSADFSHFISEIKYLTLLEKKDAEVLIQLKATQHNFNERKQLREQKKLQQETLSRRLLEQSTKLNVQKREKQALLAETQNSEATYQKLLAQALAEKLAIERALVDGVKVGPVSPGDPIALVGNTGYPSCSTGSHLHFEVRKNNIWTDPADYLSTKTIDDEQNGGTATVGRGSWGWPLADTVRITQFYGKTPWSWRYAYSGGIHTGFDMISTSSIVVRAPKNGTLYSSSETCGSSIIKIKYIDHGDGLISLYLHVQ